MSGPIIRKYGFPNFDKIFGERPLEHGADDSETPVTAPPDTTSTDKSKPAAKPKAPAASKSTTA